jgi:hypothetical protein
VELDIRHHSSVISKRVDLLVGVDVPQPHSLIITSRCNHSGII